MPKLLKNLEFGHLGRIFDQILLVGPFSYSVGGQFFCNSSPVKIRLKFIGLLMGLFRGAVFLHIVVPRKTPH